MSTTDTTVREHQATEPIRESLRRRPRPTRAVIGGLVVALGAAATTIALWSAGTDRPAAAPDPVVANPPAAYQPGGSMYDQQVPDTLDWSASYGPGSYVYDAQVPGRG